MASWIKVKWTRLCLPAFSTHVHCTFCAHMWRHEVKWSGRADPSHMISLPVVRGWMAASCRFKPYLNLTVPACAHRRRSMSLSASVQCKIILLVGSRLADSARLRGSGHGVRSSSGSPLGGGVPLSCLSRVNNVGCIPVGCYRTWRRFDRIGTQHVMSPPGPS